MLGKIKLHTKSRTLGPMEIDQVDEIELEDGVKIIKVGNVLHLLSTPGGAFWMRPDLADPNLIQVIHLK